MENSLSYLFPVVLGFRGTHLWTNPEPGSFRKQVFLKVQGPLSHYPLSFLLSPFSTVSWDFICVQKGQEPSTGSKVVESSQLLWCPSKLPALTWTRESQKCWLHFPLNVLRKKKPQGTHREGRALATCVGVIGMQAEFGNQNTVFQALKKFWGLVNFKLFQIISDI